MPQHLTVSADKRLASTQLNSLAEALREGAAAIFPTETVYGLGASVFSARGIKEIYRLKGRSWRKPLSLLVPDLRWAAPLVETIPPEAFRFAERFMPGPLTLIFKASALGRLAMGGIETVGIRIPDHPIALAILNAVGVPLATTSVNRSGEDPATSGAACRKLFAEEIEWIIDSGVCRIKEPSSVVDLSHYPFAVKREGAISKKELEKALE